MLTLQVARDRGEAQSAEKFYNQVGGFSCGYLSMRGLLLRLHQTPQNRVEHFMSLGPWMFGVRSVPTPVPRPEGVRENGG